MMEELVQKIWSQHQQTLQYILENRKSPQDDFFNQLNSDCFIEDLNKYLENKIEVVRSKIGRKSFQIGVKQWQNSTGILKRANELVKIEVVSRAKGSNFVIVLCPGDKQNREDIFNLIIKPPRRKLSPKYSTLHSKLFKVGEEEGSGKTEEVKKWLSNHLIEIHNALSKNEETK